MNAVIYCRVSSKEQVEGTSLESQALACREYAKRNGFAISRVFIEEGESAKFADRTQLLELMSYCRDRSLKIDALLVWKLDRFARNVEDHYTIKAALKKLGVRIVSVTEPIQADPNGQLMETILAGFAQFDNDVRALRTVQGMKQRLSEGIWPWKPPLGYLPPKIGKKTQPDEPDPRCFEPIRKAWQMFATGAYTKAAIIRFLRSRGVLAYRGRLITAQLLDHMFGNPYYSGVVRDPWTGNQYPGRHVAMVTTAEFARVQEIVSGRGNSQPHHRLTDNFPLRGHVRCPSCKALMTGYFAKGKRQRYAYYKCFRHHCPTRTKSYAAASVHDEFLQFLADTSLPHYVAEDIVTEFVSAYCEDTDQMRQAAARRKDEADRLRRQLQELISMRAARLVADDEFMTQRERFKSKLFQIEANHLNGEEQLTVAETGELASVLSNLATTWRNTSTEAKRGFGELLFPAGYVFQQVRTTEQGLVFKTFGASQGEASDVVPLVNCSLNKNRFKLSNGGICGASKLRTQSKWLYTKATEEFHKPKSDVVPHIKANLNTIIAEIRRLLAIIRHPNTAEKKAA